MGDAVSGGRFDFDGQPGELIRVPFLHQRCEFRRTGFFYFLEVESPGLLPEPERALDFVLLGLVEVAAETFKLGPVGAVERGKPCGELLAGRSLWDIDGGSWSLSRPRCGGADEAWPAKQS